MSQEPFDDIQSFSEDKIKILTSCSPTPAFRVILHSYLHCSSVHDAAGCVGVSIAHLSMMLQTVLFWLNIQTDVGRRTGWPLTPAQPSPNLLNSCKRSATCLRACPWRMRHDNVCSHTVSHPISPFSAPPCVQTCVSPPLCHLISHLPVGRARDRQRCLRESIGAHSHRWSCRAMHTLCGRLQ